MKQLCREGKKREIRRWKEKESWGTNGRNEGMYGRKGRVSEVKDRVKIGKDELDVRTTKMGKTMEEKEPLTQP